MKITYDNNKNQRNLCKHRIALDRAAEFDYDTARYLVDDRKEYGETRWIAVGYLDRRLHILCFIEAEDGIRAISFRKANNREVKKYGKPKTLD